MGIHECSGDRGNEPFFFFIPPPPPTAASALDCIAGALYLWEYGLGPPEAVLNQKFPWAPARLSQQLEHEKSILGQRCSTELSQDALYLERRAAQVREDQCSLAPYNQTTSSEHNEQSNVPLLIYYHPLGRVNTTAWFLCTFWPHNLFRGFTSLPANLA